MQIKRLTKEEFIDLLRTGSTDGPFAKFFPGHIDRDDEWNIRYSGFWNLYREFKQMKGRRSYGMQGAPSDKAISSLRLRAQGETLKVAGGGHKDTASNRIKRCVERAVYLSKTVPPCKYAERQMLISCTCPECARHALDVLQSHDEAHGQQPLEG